MQHVGTKGVSWVFGGGIFWRKCEADLSWDSTDKLFIIRLGNIRVCFCDRRVLRIWNRCGFRQWAYIYLMVGWNDFNFKHILYICECVTMKYSPLSHKSDLNWNENVFIFWSRVNKCVNFNCVSSECVMYSKMEIVEFNYMSCIYYDLYYGISLANIDNSHPVIWHTLDCVWCGLIYIPASSPSASSGTDSIIINVYFMYIKVTFSTNIMMMCAAQVQVQNVLSVFDNEVIWGGNKPLASPSVVLYTVFMVYVDYIPFLVSDLILSLVCVYWDNTYWVECACEDFRYKYMLYRCSIIIGVMGAALKLCFVVAKWVYLNFNRLISSRTSKHRCCTGWFSKSGDYIDWN